MGTFQYVRKCLPSGWPAAAARHAAGIGVDVLWPKQLKRTSVKSLPRACALLDRMLAATVRMFSHYSV